MATDCGTPESPCEVDGGKYFVALPEDADTQGAVIWLHGAGGSGAKAASRGFANRFTARGYVLIAPQGDISMLSHSDWSVNDGIDWPRDDVVFLNAVRADAVRRFGLDPDRVLLAGFSRGGSMVWDTACRVPEFARGFAAVSGSFWEPMVETCVAPVHLHHTHGFGDRLVPFEGRRAIYQGYNFEQGDVMRGINVWRRVNGCMGSAKNDTKDDKFWQKRWSKCEAGSITLTLTAKGHVIPKGWTDRIRN
jgi:polyhydroxybutyrate depolymerase